MSIYDEIGLPRVINAAGSMTYLGGSLMHPEVLEAMRSAAGSYVFIEDLLKWASDEIAAHTGAEAGLVTTGTTGGLILATAACQPAPIASACSNCPTPAILKPK